VSDLLERLQHALAAEYRIERDLGGGMSRVFVAQDLRLDRKVVIKVLPPELAGDVNVGRFEREIRLAARLQHPHIVPLLASGSADDLPYYVMPYLEGESLRARLDREKELPLREVVRLLREVLDALQYAHGQGVVHRDIKPDNVLITDNHAVVTDFGVAKAVFEATSEVRLTSTGIALGTPTYMAPEQIAAEPNVDHRADIYATGALAFEMLTGFPPFRGATTQAVLAAHMAQAPPSLTSLRQAIPPSLNTVVLRCLEKRPADRWQSAAEIIPHLEAIYSAESLSAPAAAASLRSTSVRVAAAFAVVSLVTLAVVLGLERALGLPDWVLQGAVVLLVVGLPIMLLTSRRERQRAVAGNTATPAGLERLFTWRRSLQGGVLAFAALGLAATLFMTSRALGIGPGATLLSAGLLDARDRIVIADFENSTPDSTLGLTVTQLLRIDLAQSPTLSVLEPAQVAEVLGRMQRERVTDITADIAREVAVREGAKAYLTGEILPAGTGFVIAARLVSSSTGDALVTLRQSAASPDKLMGAVDKLSSKLREEVGESLRSVRADPPLEQVTTSSLDALRLYAEATRAADRAGIDRAMTLLEQAVALDSGFAMAWRRIGMYASNLDQGPLGRAKGDSAVRRAYALRARLPERERLFVEAAVATTIDPDLELAAAAYSSLIDKYPNDATALNNLGAIHARQGRDDEALEMYRRAIATGFAPALTYTNATLQLAMRGLPGEADSVLAQLERDIPGSSRIPETSLALATLRLDFRAADSIARSMVRGSPVERAIGHQSLSMMATLGGRMHEASRQLRTALRVDVERGQLSAAEAEMLAQFADIERVADYTEDRETATRRLASLWEQNRSFTAPRPPILRRHLEFAMLFQQLGDTVRAKELTDEFLGLISDSDYPVAAGRMRNHVVRAAIATRTGRPDEAHALIREGCDASVRSVAMCDHMAFLEVAQAYDQAGQTDSAIAAYRRFIEWKGLRTIGPPRTVDVVTPRIAPAWRRLGELLDEKREHRQAIEAYERFLEYWDQADPDLQPIVRSVRARVDALRRASG
jgi:tetratricopeptide (TPR) repeat protein/tRNA A-37 threonylcarbamoyl transferase component Bud32